MFALDTLVREFDVYDHELGDAGYYYHFELYRDGQLARRFWVDERRPFEPDVYVREDIGVRLPGEPPPGGPIPSRHDGAAVMREVLRNLGALPESFVAPVEYRCYVVRGEPGRLTTDEALNGPPAEVRTALRELLDTTSAPRPKDRGAECAVTGVTCGGPQSALYKAAMVRVPFRFGVSK